MKKLLSVVLCLLMIVSVVSLAGCGEKASSETLKFGMGVCVSEDTPTNADGENNGKRGAEHTVAAVLLDKDSKIVDCVIDTMAFSLEFTSEGKFVQSGEFKTKYELKDDYGMKKYGQNVQKEWYEQVDAFVSVVKGKTYEEVSKYVANDGKGTEDVVNAGCTITIKDFVIALNKAVNAAKDSKATAADKLKLGFVSTQTADSKDATAEAEGANVVATTVVASAINGEGKVSAMVTDVAESKVTFDSKGVSTTKQAEAGASENATKREKGDNYGMSSYGTDLNGDGTVKEWYVQADEFDKACIGKTADEIAKFENDKGYGSDDLQKAGCTINISDMVKAAVKSAK